MKKILFFIHDLGQGGAEKVLVNLVNNMERTKFDITVQVLFAGGVNEQFLAPHIHYKSVFKKTFPANSKILKLFSPQALHKCFIKERYDIEISYLEGPSARIISGCPDKSTKLVSWIHCMHEDKKHFVASFRSFEEAKECYSRFDMTACVAENVKQNFTSYINLDKPCAVFYNTIESDKVLKLSEEDIELNLDKGHCNIVTTGTIKEVKGYDRLLRIIKRLKDASVPVRMHFLGKGPLEDELKQYVNDNGLNDCVSFLGYQTNPYKYVAKMDLFVCSSYSEGFSTAVTESLIVGTPVVTTLCSGMTELLGENDEYGIVTENNEDALFEGIKHILTTDNLLKGYSIKAKERGSFFSTDNTVRAVEKMLSEL